MTSPAHTPSAKPSDPSPKPVSNQTADASKQAGLKDGPSPSQSEKPPAKAPWRQKLRRFLIQFAVATVALLVAYGGGRLQTASKIDEAQADRDQAREKAAQAELATGKERRRIQMLEARRQVHLALIELEARNFGIAQKHLDEAGTRMDQTKPKGELAELTNRIKTTKLVASENLSAERAALIGLARSFDEALPPTQD